ncbi:MAG: SBBP repeat-containing protein, partial [Spirochaetales bacterium]|nr:SBBP repeat-containing protein [Spirochaetales bacterium]
MKIKNRAKMCKGIALTGLAFIVLSMTIGCSDAVIELSDSEAVELDKESLAIIYVGKDSSDNIINNLTLPTSGSNGTTIAWSSSNTDVIANDGTVTRPSSGDKTVTLNATISKGDESSSVTFTVVVIGYWTRLLGAAGKETYGKGMCIDSDENIYVTGITNGSIAGESLTGRYDVLISKYNRRGIMQWTKLLGGSSVTSEGYGIAVDTYGYIYVTGDTSVSGETDGSFDGQTLTGTTDMFLTKYNSSGERLWTKLSGAENTETHGYGI